MSNSLPRLRWIGLALLVSVIGLVTFEAGRRYPFEFLRRNPGPPAAPSQWEVLAVAPFQRYEGSTAVIGRWMYLFGGFSTADELVTKRVDQFEPATGTLTRLADMPTPATHRQAAVWGDTVWFAGGFLGNHPGTATDQVWGYHLTTGAWFEGPSLPRPIASGGLVALEGRLHYFGGYLADRQTTVGDHWILDLGELAAGRGRWRPAAPLPLPRGHLGGAVLGGLVYAIGGAVGHDPLQVDQDAVHRYDPRLDRWVEVAPLPAPRSHFEGATVVWNGRIIIAGGRNTNVDERYESEVTIYDPTADRWTTTLRLPRPVMSAFAGVIGDTLVVGLGREFGREAWDSTIRIHRLAPAWLPGGPLPLALDDLAGGVIGSRLYAVGSASNRTLVFDLATGRWLDPDRFATRPGPGAGNAGEVVDGRLYLLGGMGRSAGLVRIFDPAVNQWTFGPRLPFRAGAGASAVIARRIFVAGGLHGDTVVDAAARLDPGAGTWVSIAPMPRPRAYAASGTDGRRFFVFGGRSAGLGDSASPGAASDDLQIYDPATGRWTVSDDGPDSPAPLPHPHGRTSRAVYIDGRFWLFGGESFQPGTDPMLRVTDHVHLYSPATNSWTDGPPMPRARRGALGVAYEGYVYLAGGGRRPGQSSSRDLDILRLPEPTGPRPTSSPERPR